MSKSFLKVKCMSLAAEQKIIRKQEQQAKRTMNEFKWRKQLQTDSNLNEKQINRLIKKLNVNSVKRVWDESKAKKNLPKNVDVQVATLSKDFWGMRYHRTVELKQESRCSNLAYAFLRGHSYQDVERLSFNQPNWPRIERLVVKFGNEDERVILQRFAEWKDAALGGIAQDPFKEDSIWPMLSRPQSSRCLNDKW